ncbi:MAG TPA: ATP-binding cassette domain-containing protein, partial [bacterium]|nr:ATP-binding cassette domain-containing protein [bacterium]
MSPLVEVRNLSKAYGAAPSAVEALRKVSFKMEAGSFTSLMGPSGCGKSTLLQLLGGLDTPSEGEVLFEGRSLGSLTDGERSLLRREAFGFVFQFFNLLPNFNAVENVELPLLLAGLGRAQARARARVLLERVGLAGRETHRPSELSGGEQQRVAVA